MWGREEGAMCPFCRLLPLAQPQNHQVGMDVITAGRVKPFRCYGHTDLVVVYKAAASSHSEVQDIENPALKTRQRGIPAEHPSRSFRDDERMAQVFQKMALTTVALNCVADEKTASIEGGGVVSIRWSA